jgi:phage recombination protein Bet
MTPTTALTTTKTKLEQKPSALAVMASRLSVDPNKLLTTLKSTVFAKANDEELMALVVVSNEYGLNPFLKEIYAFPAKGGGICPIVSVDGWNKMLIRQPDFDGIEFEFADDGEGHLLSCTATIFLKTRSHPTKVTEYLVECKRNTDPWNTMPRRMLRNRTLCQASRLAFGFSGVSNEDEAATITVDAIPVPAELPPKIVAAPEGKTPQSELEALVLGGGYDFTTLQKFGKETGNIEDATSVGSFAEIPTDTAKRLLKAKAGLLKALKDIKDAANA